MCDKDIRPKASYTAAIQSSRTACDKHVPPEDKYELIPMVVAALFLTGSRVRSGKDYYKGLEILLKESSA